AMSRFFCQDAYALLSQEPAAQEPPVVVLEFESVTFEPPPDGVLVETVRQVCSAGWFRALANHLNAADLLDDVAQSTVRNVWRARGTFEQAYPVVCRVARIGRNALIDAARGRGRRQAFSFYDDEGEQRYDPADHRTPGPVEEALGHEMEE